MKFAEWAYKQTTPTTNMVLPNHWSRIFEYPWIIHNGNFGPSEWVLDAAGGDAPLQTFLSKRRVQVVNVDNDPNSLPEDPHKVIRVNGDLRALKLNDNIFDKVICASVLEHIENPKMIINELLRVLKPFGRLLVTMDVASYARWNHTIDMKVAKGILDMLEIEMPPEPHNILTANFAEIERKPKDPEHVSLKVLCFYLDKEGRVWSRV